VLSAAVAAPEKAMNTPDRRCWIASKKMIKPTARKIPIIIMIKKARHNA
jgi:hypothetical protein